MTTEPRPQAPRPRSFHPAAAPWGRVGLVLGAVAGLSTLPFVSPSTLPPPRIEEPALTGPERRARERIDALVDDDGRIRGPAVVNVWLEGCRDCMPAFEAWRRLVDVGALEGIPVWNVAYGRASAEFVQRYALDDNLVVDADGGRVVRPFGIGSFTTLVVDAEGREVLRDRPEREGYTERVRATWARLRPALDARGAR